jgi:hypothetical protein
MATPWEKDETITNGKALEKQAKLWIAPQSFKSWWKITDNIIGFLHSHGLSLRVWFQKKWAQCIVLPKGMSEW